MLNASPEPLVEESRIDRPLLAKQLIDALDRGSILLVAEAGFGKTTVLEQALGRAGHTQAWVSATRADRDPGVLVAHIADALRKAVPGSADVLVERFRTAAGPVDVGAACWLLVAEVDRLLVDRLVLVLDDCECLAGASEALGLVSTLLATAPRRLRLAVASRSPIRLRTAKLRNAGRLIEVGAAKLAFTHAECASLLAARRGRAASPEDVEALMDRTQGWPLGIALGAISGDLAFDRSEVRQELFAYLAEEVLEEREEVDRVAVLDSSVPPELSAEVTTALGLPDDFSAKVERAGLFLRPTEPTRSWFRYHPLFRELLRVLWRKERSEVQRRETHARAARAMTDAGRPHDALEHWLAASRFEEVLQELERHAPQLLQRSPGSLRSWLDRLPGDLDQHPVSNELRGQLAWMAGDHETAARRLREAVAGHRARTSVVSEWRARFALVDTQYNLGSFDDAVALADGFDAEDARAAGPLAPGVAMYAAVALAALGRRVESDELAGRALAHPRAAVLSPVDAIRACFVDVPAGRVDEALRGMKAAEAELERMDPWNRLGHVRMGIALILVDLGRDRDALAYLGRVREAAELTPYVLGVSRVYAALLHARNGRLAEAEVELAHLEGVPAIGWRRWIYEAARAAVAQLRGNVGDAVVAAGAAREAAGPAPAIDRWWMAVELVPVLARAGHPAAARDLVEEALEVTARTYPRSAGPFLRARLHGLRSWLRHRDGDLPGAHEDLAQLWTEAGHTASDLIRREWSRLEEPLWSALESGALEPVPVMRAIEAARPGSEALIRFTRHPVAAVRRAVLGPAAASGDPAALRRLHELAEEPASEVGAAARAAAAAIIATPPPLVVNLLGGFAVRRGTWRASDSDWGRPMAARLVRFLLVSEGGVPEDALFEAFWPDKAPQAARRNLQVAVSLARGVLDPPGAATSALEVSERTYGLSLGEEGIVDVDQFTTAASTALGTAGHARRALLDRAASLWAGEPLPEDRYAEWSTAWRVRLTERYAQVLTALVEECRRSGDQLTAIDVGSRLVALDPLNESAHRELIAAYARAGRTSYALRQYLECRRALVDELGIEPAEETSALQSRILVGEPV